LGGDTLEIHTSSLRIKRGTSGSAGITTPPSPVLLGEVEKPLSGLREEPLEQQE